MKRVAPKMVGKQYGELVVESFEYRGGASFLFCKCSCGNTTVVSQGNLNNGHTKSCGCRKGSAIHGMSKTPLYSVWSGIKSRCYDKNNVKYHLYGGRGIAVCDEWLNDFKKFHDDMCSGYKTGLQIDRRNNDKGYSKANCHWVTSGVNSKNRRTSLFVIYNGKKVYMADLADKSAVDYGTLKYRIKAGWDVNRAVTEPARKYLGASRTFEKITKMVKK